MTAAQRVINIPGAVNLRELGGYRTESGRVVRSGVLFRSGTLTHLTAEGQQAFADLGVALICDLRRPDEKTEEPTPLPSDQPTRLEIPIDPGSAVELRKRLRDTGLTLAERVDYMTSLTGELTRDHAPDYVSMFDGLLSMDDGGFLVHCSAGKDRTGVAVALILHALGVPRHTIVEDYLFTNNCMDYEGYILPKWVARFSEENGNAEQLPDKESVMALFGVREEYLQAAYAGMEAEFEGVEHYITDALGLSQGDRQALQARFLL